MQAFARMPSNLIPTGSDDIVVVGRISLNTKKAKRNLTKIADQNSRKVFENSRYEAPKASIPSKNWTQDTPNRSTSQRSRQRTKAPVRTLAKVQSAPVEPVEQTATVQLLVNLPDAVLAHLFLFADVSALGRFATTCHTVHAVLGAESAVWSALGGMRGLVMRASIPREAFRQAHFGLEGTWLPAFTEFAASGEPQEVLHEADFLTGGMVAANRSQAHSLVQVVASAAARCTVDLDDAAAMLLSTLRKVESRPEVFNRASQLAVREAHLDMRERAVLERLAQDDTPTFDYFQTEEDEEPADVAEWEDLEPGVKSLDLNPDDARELAASFLEVMGLRHGHDLQETQTAIRALQ
jgi:hypothetical protein